MHVAIAFITFFRGRCAGPADTFFRNTAGPRIRAKMGWVSLRAWKIRTLAGQKLFRKRDG